MPCGKEFSLDDIYENLDGPDEDRTPSSLIDIYLHGFEKGGVIEQTEGWRKYIIKNKITKKITILDFLEKTEGGDWKEWFVQVCE